MRHMAPNASQIHTPDGTLAVRYSRVGAIASPLCHGSRWRSQTDRLPDAQTKKPMCRPPCLQGTHHIGLQMISPSRTA